MSQDSFNSEASTNTTATSVTTGQIPSSHSSPADYSAKIQSAIHSLSSITPIPPSVLSSPNPAAALLHDPQVSSQISALLRQPDSGAGDNQLCRWFYDTFQTNAPQLQLLVLRFLPVIAGLYLSRIPQRKPSAGFEAVLLALYAYETTTRNGQAITVNIPNLSNSSIYHETKDSSKSMSSELNIAVISPSLEPHGTVRATRRARIVGVALELYFSKIASIPLDSKIDFCEFCELWAGQNGDMYKEVDVRMEEVTEKKEGNSGRSVGEEKEGSNDVGMGEEEKDKRNDLRSDEEKEGNNDVGLGEEEKDKRNELRSDEEKDERNDVGVEEKNKSNVPQSDEEKDERNDVELGGEHEKEENNGVVSVGEKRKEERNDAALSEEKKAVRINLPWELMQPVLRILGHCLLGPKKDEKLMEAASGACRSLYARSIHDINPKAILATRSLLRLTKLAKVSHNDVDYTEIQFTNVISI